ncbi:MULTISPECIES: protein-glutamate O-methyltransferase CheR [unclassified Saccharibacter]|uniref:CheR family methyltransferase n=1 Tax=unclassified Saccharibacter TaxID=2648722 RepID=UPI0013262474|nr:MULTISPECIES: protein-glutamate O-methyltransferase [unclassified Saccharibacter]MXV36042.1 chemotaxis protein [Saccharibacter sp. EH611]MXV56901.1 chemotaxis protein [Saccharibacter sp. EH70]MXV66739.1 chemotaxis protein [Saccharibacter sp. EH60]
MSFPDAAGDFSYSEHDFQRVQTIALREAGISLPVSKRSLVFSRVSRRIRATGKESFGTYLDYVSSPDGMEEMQELICVLTTNVTQFFREKSHFEHLEDHVAPHMSRTLRSGGRCRMWSAACSTGQEAWSMAMSVVDKISDAPWLDMKILATDINHSVVNFGQAGQYLAEEVQTVPDHMRRKFMEPNGVGGFRMTGEIRRLPVFKPLNLNRVWPFHGSFDVIFCRNVVIYFDDETRNALWKRLAGRLVPGGFLYVGHSERVENMRDCGLEAVAPTIYIKRA